MLPSQSPAGAGGHAGKTLGTRKTPKSREDLGPEVKRKTFLNSGRVPVRKLNWASQLVGWEPPLPRGLGHPLRPGMQPTGPRHRAGRPPRHAAPAPPARVAQHSEDANPLP